MKVPCSRCGGPTRKSPRYPKWRCRQALGPCGRWWGRSSALWGRSKPKEHEVMGADGRAYAMFFETTETRADGSTVPLWVPTTAPDPATAFPSALLGHELIRWTHGPVVTP